MVGGAPVLNETLEHHSDKVNDVIYVAEDDYYITGSKDTTLALWKKKKGALYEVVFRRGVRRSISKLGFDYASGTLFAGFYNGNVNKYRIKDGATIEHIKTYENQTDRVTDIVLNAERNLVMSTSRDRTLVVRRLETMEILSSYTFADWATCLQYCPKSNVVFVGVATGQIHILSVATSGDLKEVHVLKGHATVVTRLLWLERKGWLCSASEDSRIVVWDIDGKNGVSYELNAHTTPVRSLCYLEDEDELLSLDDSKSLVVWDMGRDRRPAHDWSDSDTCQLCGKSFFWVMAFPPNTARQHHCRRCGMALCGSCVPLKKPFPRGGFELPVYLCKSCAPELAPEDLAPTIDRYELPVSFMQWDEEARCLIGVSTENNNVQLFQFPETELSRKMLKKRAEKKGKSAGKEAASSSGAIKRTSSIPPVTNKREADDVKRAIDLSNEQNRSPQGNGGTGSGSGQRKDKGGVASSSSGSARVSPAVVHSELEPALMAVSDEPNADNEDRAQIDKGRQSRIRPDGSNATVRARTPEKSATPSPEPVKRKPLKSAFAGGLFDSDGNGSDSDEEEASGFVNGRTQTQTRNKTPTPTMKHAKKPTNTQVTQPVTPETTFAEVVSHGTDGEAGKETGEEDACEEESEVFSNNSEPRSIDKGKDKLLVDKTPVISQGCGNPCDGQDEENMSQDNAAIGSDGSDDTDGFEDEALHPDISNGIVDVEGTGEQEQVPELNASGNGATNNEVSHEQVGDQLSEVSISPDAGTKQEDVVDASDVMQNTDEKNAQVEAQAAIAT